MLDEVAAAADKGAIQATPGQYFAGIANRYIKGEFTPVVAYQAAQRRHRERESRASKEPAVSDALTPSEVAREHLARFRQQLLTAGASGSAIKNRELV